MSKVLSLTLLLVAAGPLLATPPSTPTAPVGEKEDALLEDEIRFAENLARYRFYNLAIAHLGEVKGKKLSNELEGTAVLTEARIYKSASLLESDEDRRLEHQATAISLLHDWKQPGSPYAFHDRRVDALKDLADLLRERADTYKRRAMDPANPSADTSKALADQDYDDADETYELLRREAESRAEQYHDMEQEAEAIPFEQMASNTYLWRGINNIEWSAVAKDAEFKLENAVEDLENYQWDLPDEGMLQGYVAMQYQAQAMFLLGQAEDAFDLWDQVLDEMIFGFWDPRPATDDYPARQGIADFAPFERASIAGVTARTWGMKAAAQLASGDLPGATATIDAMVAKHDQRGQPLGREGHQVLLDWYLELDAVGQGPRALDLLKRIAAEGQGTREGTMAGRYLSEAIGGSGATTADSVADVSPEVLMSVAESQRRDGDNREAAFTYMRVVAQRDEAEDPVDVGIRGWMGLATVLRRDGRHLEAGLAFEQTVAAIEAAGLEDDAEVSETWRDAVTYWQRSMEDRYKATRHDFDRDLRDAARQAALDRGIGSSDTAFSAAKEVFEEAQGQERKLAQGADRGALEALYREAASEFTSIEENAASYESALVYRGRALAGAGDADEALALFDEMIRRSQGPRPTDPSARSRREQATAEAIYYKALLLADLDRPAEVLATLEGIEEAVPGQQGVHEQAKYQRVIASAALGDLAATKAAVQDLESSFPDSSSIPNAAFRLATTLDDAATAAAGAGDAARALDLRSQAAEAMYRHCELAGFPSFPNLMRAAQWFVEAGRGEDAEVAYQTAVDRFAGSLDDSRVDEARIGLGTALNAQRDFGTARALWQELLERDARRPAIVTGAALCFGGWLQDDGAGGVEEVAGSGDYAEAFELWKQLIKGYDVEAKYSEPWWEAKLGAIYTQYRLGASDSQGYFNARKVLENQKLTTPGYDEDTRDNLPPEQAYTRSFKPLFRYLDRTIPNG